MVIKDLEIINEIYLQIKNQIDKRLVEFKENYRKGNDKDIFLELVFCLLTPQSKAKTCWKAALSLKENNLLFSDDREKISNIINSVEHKEDVSFGS